MDRRGFLQSLGEGKAQASRPGVSRTCNVTESGVEEGPSLGGRANKERPDAAEGGGGRWNLTCSRDNPGSQAAQKHRQHHHQEPCHEPGRMLGPEGRASGDGKGEVGGAQEEGGPEVSGLDDGSVGGRGGGGRWRVRPDS